MRERAMFFYKRILILIEGVEIAPFENHVIIAEGKTHKRMLKLVGENLKRNRIFEYSWGSPQKYLLIKKGEILTLHWRNLTYTTSNNKVNLEDILTSYHALIRPHHLCIAVAKNVQ